MIEIKNLSVTGKNQVGLLHNIEFCLSVDDTIALTGGSGAGKTTLIKAIMGILDDTCSIVSGDILLDGKSIIDMSAKQRRMLCGTTIGFIPQNPMTAFDSQYKIGKQMIETFRMRLNLNKNDALSLVSDVLTKVNLMDIDRIISSYPSQLSGGMLQRITMAILWGLKPKYILADEPTSALDEENRNLLIELLLDYPEKCGIIFLSHDAVAIQRLCANTMIMEAGMIIEKAPTMEIFQTPKAEWTKRFVQSSSLNKGGEWEWIRL